MLVSKAATRLRAWSSTAANTNAALSANRTAEAAPSAQVDQPLPEANEAQHVHPRVGPHLERIPEEEEAPQKDEGGPGCVAGTHEGLHHPREDGQQEGEQAEVQETRGKDETAGGRAFQETRQRGEKVEECRGVVLYEVLKRLLAVRDEPRGVQVDNLVVVKPGARGMENQEREDDAHRRVRESGTDQDAVHVTPDRKALHQWMEKSA